MPHKVTAKVRIGNIYGKEPFTHEVLVTEYVDLNDAVKALGGDKMLKYVNYAQRLYDLADARRKFTTMYEGPEKRKIKEARKVKV